ncbi:MAG TPA: hydrogenase formation protein HypD [Bacteroidales bacterium]|nr:hydrogenase formation protein HypD [Bacteroidales bacterium]
MKYISEYRDAEKVQQLAAYIKQIAKEPMVIMEVCGSHTMSIHRFGLKHLLPEHIVLVSGPGCPVCVTPVDYIDKAVALARIPDVIIATYGDLVKVPGSSSSLEKEKAKGADVRMVYSVLESIDFAVNNPDKKVVFLAIGFETTTPPTAAGILKAKELGLDNFSVLSSHKIMPPPMQAIIEEGIAVDAFLAPGHVSVITGTEMYNFIPEKFGKGVVVSGFEPIDVLQSVIMLIKQKNENRPSVEIQYTRVVKPEGNPKAQQMVNEIFEPADANWRGLGIIPKSALSLREKYKSFDAEHVFQVIPEQSVEAKGCICGQVLKGLKKPSQCGLYGNKCVPENPVGACMVSSEGACNVYYKYGE